jgi:hypothetical protein
MWQPSRKYEKSFTAPEPGKPVRMPFRWARSARHSRFSGSRITPTKCVLVLMMVGIFIMVRDTITYAPKGVGIVSINLV